MIPALPFRRAPKSTFAFAVLVLLFAAWPCTSPGAGLELECELGGERLPLVSAGNGILLIRRGEALIPAPMAAAWHLTGDIRENARFVRWAPRHELRAEPPAEYNGLQPTVRAEIKVDSETRSSPGKFVLNDWPKAGADECALVAVWLTHGTAAKVRVRPLRLPGAGGYTAQVSFLLSPAAAKGQPLLLLWSPGGFLAPVPEFADEANQRAFVATLLDDVGGLRDAAAAGAKLKKKSRTGASLAHYAAMANAAGTLQFLIDQIPALAKADAQFEDDSPLRWAALTGRTATAQVLLQSGVSPSLRDGSEGPLEAAVYTGQSEIINLLLKAGAPPHCEHGPDPLNNAVNFGYKEIAEALLAAGGRYDFSSIAARRNLVNNAGAGRVPFVRFLLEHGVDPNAEEFVPGPRMALTVNTPGGPVELPAEKAPAIPPETGTTALMKAAESGSVQTATALLEHGADPNRQTSRGVTALHLAADANSVAVVQLLLDHHADITKVSQTGLTPLEAALLDGANEAAGVLAAAGARIDRHSPRAGELLVCSLRGDVAGVIASVIGDGWSPNSRIDGIGPALTLARYFGAKGCASVLAAAGAAEPDSQALPLVKLTELDKPVKPLKSERPANVRLHSQSEIVRIEFILNADGRPLFVHALESTDRNLANATVRTVADWRFTPPTQGGKPVCTRVVLPIEFKGGYERGDTGIPYGVPEILRTAKPVYPAAFTPHQKPGWVTLDFLVKADGSIDDVKVIAMSDPVFENSAREALKGYRFGPRTIDGLPVDDRLRLTIDIAPPR